MVTPKGLARSAVIFSCIAILAAFLLSGKANAAVYAPNYWFISAGASYDVVNPVALNRHTSDFAPLPGIPSFRLLAERGLYFPKWSHWVEFGYHTGYGTGSQPTENGLLRHKQHMKHLSILPFGATYWVAQSAFIDFGLSAGLGLGISPTATFTQTAPDKTVTETKYTGGVGPIIDTHVNGRFWLSRHLAFSLGLGMRYYGPTLQATSGSQIKANLFSLNTVMSITYAFGGVKGTGRTYVEIIPAQPPKARRGPTLRTPTTPQGLAPAKQPSRQPVNR